MSVDSKDDPRPIADAPATRSPAFALAHEGGIISGPDEHAVRRVVASIEGSRARRASWPRDGRAAMMALVRLFPSMREVPGTDPWSVEDLIAWCNSGAPTSGSDWAARFLLAVWNPGTDWSEYGLPGRGKFDLMEAWSCWDERHRAAALRWLEAPFWP